MWSASWDDVEVVEVLCGHLPIGISEQNLLVIFLDLDQLGVLNHVNISLGDLLSDHLVSLRVELTEFVVGIDDCQCRQWADLANLLEVLPALVGVEESVGSDLSSERILGDIEEGIAVGVVANPPCILGMAVGPLVAVNG